MRCVAMASINSISLRFGFDLTPLFDRLHEIASLAAETLRARDQIAFLRLKIRAAANEALRQNPEDITAQDTLRLLRRKLTVAERAVNDLTDFTHALQHGSNPARRQGIKLHTRVFGMQPREQRLRHDRVADPRGGNDKSLHKATVAGMEPATFLVMTLGGFALEDILGTAIRTNHFARFQDVEKDTRMQG